MIKIKDILAGKAINKSVVKKQQLAAAMAWQIINIYPKRKNANDWQIYENLRGVLLADEVGGGKTFEALTLITKAYLKGLQFKKRNFRILIIANPAIRSKWEWKGNNCDLAIFYHQVKIKNKIHAAKLKSLLSNIYLVNSKSEWKNIDKTLPAECIILTSVQALPPTYGRKSEANFQKKYKLPPNKFHWIIADEAHIVKSGYAQKDEDIGNVSNSAVRKLYATLNSQMNAKIVLLTATPFHNNVLELKQMISLLDHTNGDGVIGLVGDALVKLQQEFIELKDSVDSENDFAERLKKINQAANHNINLLFEEDDNSFNRPNELKTNGQRNGLDDFLRDVMIRNRKEKLNEEISKIELNSFSQLNYLLLRDLVFTEEEDGKRMISTQLCQLVSNPESLRRSFESKKLKNHSKRLKLYTEIENYFGEENLYNLKLNELLGILQNISLDNKNIVTVFCRFIPAIKQLEKDLKTTGLKTWCLDGSTKVDERKRLLRRIENFNSKNKKTGVLLVSQVGNEGLDFDKFSDTIIHFDGHYNPAVIAQRNGRVYRRENNAKDISVYHLILGETYDQRIKFIEEEKKRLKDFYLGDSTLEILFEKILSQQQSDKKESLKKLLKFSIDLEPQKKYLLPKMKHEVH
jgi:SNF2 family DNA or RNA helicase